MPSPTVVFSRSIPASEVPGAIAAPPDSVAFQMSTPVPPSSTVGIAPVVLNTSSPSPPCRVDEIAPYTRKSSATEVPVASTASKPRKIELPDTAL